MGEESKIPVPKAKSGGSLFERAEGAFDLGGAFKPAPVPGFVPKRPAPAVPALAAATIAPAPLAPRAFEPAPPPEPASAPEVVATPVQPVRFSGPQYAIDRAHLREQGLIEPEGGVTALLEEFRIVKRQLLQAAREGAHEGDHNTQRILICSPLPGEGKTFCAVNLALAIAAEQDSEVLLVDADFAKPSVLSVLGLPGGPGLMDALADPSLRVEDCVIGTDIPGLSVLPAGNQTTRDSEYLASDRTPAVLDRLTQGAPNRMVIFDSPPALAASPAAELAKFVGQALLIVRADTTGQSAIEDALHLLSTCPDIKLLLNAAMFSPSGRRFGSFYGYGA
ncbi:MAG: capsular biosynthesis protein [Candidatus Andeanibacterium colombiense]|uniref:Capsular biosynthesis protein n=1 Tax=Candidatus Andeanibacterium colombiense TaxID=3121345 RepID=A0AAJ5X943_9SPHN|nr:MAG: capsular biosynthesis protein [Sphingomonadaceae bacterium]